jgi:L-lysine 6-transaminase
MATIDETTPEVAAAASATASNDTTNGTHAEPKGSHPMVPASAVHATLNRYILADGFDFVLDLERSQGSWLQDAATGKRYLDFFTFFASNPIGMNHPKLATPEFIEKIGRVALHKPSNSDIYTSEMATFVKTFFAIAVPDYFKYSFFIEGGALAVENALKVAFDWKVRKNFHKGYTHERGHRVIHFRHAFHGRSGYTMSLTNTDPGKTNYYPKFPDWPRIDTPIATFPLEGENLRDIIAAEEASLAAVREAFFNNPDHIACVIIEPIQGEGGDTHFRKEFLQGLRDLCDENEALLIFDEVQSGIGITGEWWAHQAIGVRPDIISFGKKTQICGILVTDRVDDVPHNVFHTSSRINSTWGGNLVDMVRFTRMLEIIAEEDLVGNAKRVGVYLLEKLQGLVKEYPKTLANPRGRGLMCAFDFSTAQDRDLFRQKCYDKGMMILGCGDHSIRFRPPLNVSKDEIDQGVVIIREAIDEVTRGQ